MDLIRFLEENNVNQKLVDDALYFRKYYQVDEQYRDRIPQPSTFYGKEVWEMCVALEPKPAISGPKHGKNVLADNLYLLFGRPQWNVSFHIIQTVLP